MAGKRLVMGASPGTGLFAHEPKRADRGRYAREPPPEHAVGPQKQKTVLADQEEERVNAKLVDILEWTAVRKAMGRSHPAVAPAAWRMRSLLVASVACALVGVRGAYSFVLQCQPELQPDWRLLGSRRNIHRVPATSRGATSFLGSTQFSIPVSFLAAGAAVVTLRRSRVKTVRKVTMEDLEQITVEDIPKGWQQRISIGKYQRRKICSAIKERLDDLKFIMAWNYDLMDTPQKQDAVAMFPETVNVRALKNSLVRKAMEGTPWEEFGQRVCGSNCYVFVNDENDIKAVVKAFLKMEKEFNRKEKVAQMYEIMQTCRNPFNKDLFPCAGGMVAGEWEYIPGNEIKKLENFMTKTDLIARIAGSIKQVTQKLAVSVKQVPQKLAIGTKKIVEKMEEDGKSTVADAVV